MDAASSEWKIEKGKGYYNIPKAGTEYTSEELIEHWAKLCDKYKTGLKFHLFCQITFERPFCRAVILL